MSEQRGQLLPIRKAAKLLGRSRDVLRKLIEDGRLTAYQWGGRAFYLCTPAEDLEALEVSMIDTLKPSLNIQRPMRLAE